MNQNLYVGPISPSKMWQSASRSETRSSSQHETRSSIKSERCMSERRTLRRMEMGMSPPWTPSRKRPIAQPSWYLRAGLLTHGRQRCCCAGAASRLVLGSLGVAAVAVVCRETWLVVERESLRLWSGLRVEAAGATDGMSFSDAHSGLHSGVHRSGLTRGNCQAAARVWGGAFRGMGDGIKPAGRPGGPAPAAAAGAEARQRWWARREAARVAAGAAPGRGRASGARCP